MNAGQATNAGTGGRALVAFVAAMLVLVVAALAAGVVATTVSALVGHQLLVVALGEEGIPAFDDTIGMRILVVALYAIGVVVALALFAFGGRFIWRHYGGVVRSRVSR